MARGRTIHHQTIRAGCIPAKHGLDLQRDAIDGIIARHRQLADSAASRRDDACVGDASDAAVAFQPACRRNAHRAPQTASHSKRAARDSGSGSFAAVLGGYDAGGLPGLVLLPPSTPYSHDTTTFE